MLLNICSAIFAHLFLSPHTTPSFYPHAHSHTRTRVHSHSLFLSLAHTHTHNHAHRSLFLSGSFLVYLNLNVARKTLIVQGTSVMTDSRSIQNGWQISACKIKTLKIKNKNKKTVRCVSFPFTFFSLSLFLFFFLLFIRSLFL